VSIRNLAFAAVLISVITSYEIPALAQKASFKSLGQMPGAMRGAGTFPNALSADGSTIVGYAWVCPNGKTNCDSSGKTEAFFWTAAGKYQRLGDLGNEIGSMALATSLNGSVVVGNAPAGTNDFGAFRWTAAQGMVALPVELFFGNGVTSDGTMVVGGDNWWNVTGQLGIFGPFPGNQDQTQAFGITGTEQAPIAVGAALKGSNDEGAAYHAFSWTPANGLEDLGLTTGTQSIAVGISSDGSVVAGEATDSNGFWRAFRWTASTGMQDIGTLGGPESIAYSANQDGSVIVGSSLTSGSSGSGEAFIWTAKTGMQDLRAVLDAQGVRAPEKWVTFVSATGISADGTVIIGFGQNPRSKAFPFGVNTPFRIVLPAQ